MVEPVLVAIVVDVEEDVVVISGIYTIGTGCPCCNLDSFLLDEDDIFRVDVVTVVAAAAVDADFVKYDVNGSTGLPNVLGNNPLLLELCVNGDGITNPPGVFIGFGFVPLFDLFRRIGVLCILLSSLDCDAVMHIDSGCLFSNWLSGFDCDTDGSILPSLSIISILSSLEIGRAHV